MRRYSVRVAATAQPICPGDRRGVKQLNITETFMIIKLYALEIAGTLVFIVFISVEAAHVISRLFQ
jgi:hypothetical protein